MFEFLSGFCTRPAPFSRYTVKELWTKPHLSEQMLRYHLSQETDLASRRISTIDRIVEWIDSQVSLEGRKLCDLGCGPGLYTQRFSDAGAVVTGVDFSERAIDYAVSSSDRSIAYIKADYLNDELPSGFDIVTLIYTDFCVLSPEQRAALLHRIHQLLDSGGRLVLDVAGMGMYESRSESYLIEHNLMDGFWSASDYVGMQKTLVYAEHSLVLDRFAIIEQDRTWEVYNWFQHYTPESISAELAQYGFTITRMKGSLTGEDLEDRSDLIGIIAEAS